MRHRKLQATHITESRSRDWLIPLHVPGQAQIDVMIYSRVNTASHTLHTHRDDRLWETLYPYLESYVNL